MVSIAGCGDIPASTCCMPKCLQMLPTAPGGGVNPLGLRTPLSTLRPQQPQMTSWTRVPGSLPSYLGQSPRQRWADMPELLTSGTDLCRGILWLHPGYLARLLTAAFSPEQVCSCAHICLTPLSSLPICSSSRSLTYTPRGKYPGVCLCVPAAGPVPKAARADSKRASKQIRPRVCYLAAVTTF